MTLTFYSRGWHWKHAMLSWLHFPQQASHTRAQFTPQSAPLPAKPNVPVTVTGKSHDTRISGPQAMAWPQDSTETPPGFNTATLQLLALFNDVRLFTTPEFPRGQRKRRCGGQALLEEKAAAGSGGQQCSERRGLRADHAKKELRGAGRNLLQ